MSDTLEIIELNDEIVEKDKEIETHIKLNKQLLEDIDRAGKEIERLQKDLTYYQEYSADLLNKNNTFENIIKEVREYMNKHEIEAVYLDCKLYETQVYKDILEILDKGE